MKTPDILNSKIKDVRIELPHYSFSHSSSSTESRRGFVGRKTILRKLKELVRDAGDTIGVYLVTGARGVGKSNLIEEVIRGTSLQFGVVDRLKHLFFLLCAVAGAQFCLDGRHLAPVLSFIANFFTTSYGPPADNANYCAAIFWVSCGLWLISAVMLCYFNEYGREGRGVLNYFRGIFREIGDLGCGFGSYRKTRYLLKVIFTVGLTQVVSNGFRVFAGMEGVTATKIFSVGLGFALVWSFLAWICGAFLRLRKRKKNKYDLGDNSFWGWIKENIFKKFGDVIEGHNRMYLRINFGHRLKDEKDILRLIARTLLTEYRKYHRSFWRLAVWRAVSVVFLFIFASLLGDIAGKLRVYESVKRHLATDVGLNRPAADGLYSKGDYAAYVEHIKASGDGDEVGGKKVFIIKDFLGVGAAKKFILAADTLVLGVSRKAEKFPRYLWSGKAEDRAGGLNHPFWFSFIFLYVCFVAVFSSKRLSRYFVTHRRIMSRLKDLNNDITYGTERERSISVNGPEVGERVGALGRVGAKIKRSRGVADAREIERELQNIFQDVRRIPVFMGRPKLVIVFDELDKVEPGDIGLENSNPETKAALFSIDAARERQSEILKILSNMKYFLSTSEAKFIFIAGREMYDIYLADVSDRNNYIGSIFSAVIEVPSFLTDHAERANKADMTSLTEEFVCRRLFPRYYAVRDGLYNLENYRRYLEKEIFRGRSDDDADGKERQIHKVISVLQQFIIYIAHVSKGAPKKMMQLFESFIEVRDADSGKGGKKNKKGGDISVRYYRRSKFFLIFDNYHQYTLGLIAYLITPIFYRLVEGNISNHNDKLLVSSLRFVDFVFKFHKHPFMWKHLDISPEMLEVNRAPELQPITADLLNYMAQIHIAKSNFSLFDYRFDNLIANEIFAATKTNEVASALFSFSLDETLPLKKHYQDLLAKTQKEYQNDRSFSATAFIDAISSLQIVLGDLHYFDGQLEEAGIYYRDAIEALRKMGARNDDDKEKGRWSHEAAGNDMDKYDKRDRGYREDLETMNPEQLYLFVRNMLKVGMIYETRKQHEQAYLIYGEVCRLVVRERDIAVRELGAGIAIRKNKENGKNEFIKTSAVGAIDRKSEMYNDNVEYQEAFWGMVDSETAQLQPLYFQRISPNTNDMLFRKMTYEGLKLLYLPFLVKLQILEKSHIGGIARTHLEQLDKEFEHLTFIIDHEEANILEADFCSRAADILYYKNSDLKRKRNKNRRDDEDDDKYIEEKKLKSNGEKPTSKDEELKHKNCSCTACYYYYKALFKLLNKDDENKKGIDVKTLLEECVDIFKDTRFNLKFCTVLARVLSNWGNVFLSCDISGPERNDGENDACYICDGENRNTRMNVSSTGFLDDCAKYAVSEKENGAYPSLNLNSLRTKRDIAFAMYSISSAAFRNAGNHNRAAYQIYKMLRLFKRYKIKNMGGNIKDLSRKAVNLLWNAADELNALELNDRKKVFGEKAPLRYLLVDSEIAIIAVLAKELELELNVKAGENAEPLEKRVETLKKLYDSNVASPDGIIYSISARIFQLRLKADINYEAYKMLLPTRISGDEEFGISEEVLEKEIKSVWNDEGAQAVKEIFTQSYYPCDTKNIFAELVSESIFCLKEVVRLAKTLNESYLFNHSFIGKIHERLAFWIRRYERYKKHHGKDDSAARMRESLQYFLDYQWEEQLSYHYENRRALSHYYKCLETHTEGKAYHTMIDNMYYVKDEYNDHSDHFSIAVERHKILRKEVEKWIKGLKKDSTATASLYDADNYFDQVNIKGE